ncbi:MAG TPA: ester cyclase [Terracidiphilus sp.]|jgi:steroid delta-isomerase-like uncharacterized protein
MLTGTTEVAMLEQNKQLARRWFEEVWNQGSEVAIDEMFHPDGKAHGFPDAQSALEGPEAFKEIHRSFHQIFSDIHVQVEDVIAEGDRVAIRWFATLTHRGDGLGFPATGKTARMEGSSFVTVQGGQIHTGWNHMDFQGLVSRLQQRAAEPEPDAMAV